jgi:hypothetical protein
MYKDTSQVAASESAEREQILCGLAKKIEDEFSRRATARVYKERQWIEALRLYNSPLSDNDIFSVDKPFDIQPGRRRPVANIIRTKCDAAIANCVSMQFAGGEKNWDLWPAANDKDPASASKCKGMEREILAQLDACNYGLQSRRAMADRVILGSGVVKGPVNTGKLRTKYVKSGDIWLPELVEDYTPSITHVTPWRFYPDLTVTRHEESDSDIELHPMTATELSMLRRSRGFDKEVIEQILAGETGIKAVDYNTNYLTQLSAGAWSQPHMYKDRYTVLEYHGPISYDSIEKLGLDPNFQSPTSEYYGEVWVVCGKVIRMELENIEGALETPYAVSVWKEDPTSPFGFGNPLVLADAQRVVTQSYHMILDNASLTAGPQIGMIKQYMEPADGVWEITPNKIWLLTDPMIKIQDALHFHNPTNNINSIMQVLELARMFGEEESATTAMAAGLPSPQAAESATGALVMQQNSTTILDFLSEEWDDNVTEKVIRRMYAWNMQYNPKDDIKGDYQIDVRSSSSYKNKQLHIRDLERLSMEANQNEAMAMWLNMDQLTKARLNMMNLPSNNIIKTDEQYQEAVQAAQQQPNPQMVEMQIKMAEAQRADRELALEEAKLQFEMAQVQQREQWEHEERMGANYARAQEAQAQVIKARAEVDVKMLELALRKEAAVLDAETKRLMKENDTQAKVFIEGMRRDEAAIDQMLVKQELDLKQQTGEGI